MKKKWVYVIVGAVLLFGLLLFVVPYVIVSLSYSSIMTEGDESPSAEFKGTNKLEFNNGKYIVAFSELKSNNIENTGAFYVVDKDGKYISNSEMQNISEPMGMTTTNGKAYVVNNRSTQRSMVDLKTGSISTINTSKGEEVDRLH